MSNRHVSSLAHSPTAKEEHWERRARRVQPRVCCKITKNFSQSVILCKRNTTPSPPPSRDRHSDTCGGAVAWRRFPAARGEGWKPTRHTSRPDATAHTYTAHAAHTYVILNAGHNTATNFCPAVQLPASPSLRPFRSVSHTLWEQSSIKRRIDTQHELMAAACKGRRYI